MNDHFDRDSGIFRGAKVPDRAEILSMISHDMRAPLMAILASAEMMASDPAGVPEDHRKMLGVIERSGRRLEALAQELAELGAAGRGTLTLERAEHDLAQVIDMAVEEVAVTVEARGKRLHCEVHRSVRCGIDRQRFTRAVVNVLVNAVRHCRQNITVTLRDDEDGMALIAVEDDGDGIDDEMLPRMFEPFVRAEHGGKGLGLAVVREVVRAHGGFVRACNREDGPGARIEMRLPTGEAASRPVKA